MALRKPRNGTSAGFHVYPSTNDVTTIADPETILWSSIRHLCSRSVAEQIAAHVHGVRLKGDIDSVRRNLKVYIQQAAEFYEVAKSAKPNTAPLIYYYSYLNLAKALCELRSPRFHKRPECYRHGIGWRPSSDYLVNLETEKVSLTTRGVWHALWESFSHNKCRVANPTKFSIKHLFSYCVEVGTEFEMAFGTRSRLVSLVDPDILYDAAAKEAWIRFSVYRSDLQLHRFWANALTDAVATPRSSYVEVRADVHSVRTFESKEAVKFSHSEDIPEVIQNDVRGMNVFCAYIESGDIGYELPVQTQLPISMPQMMVIYSILFWLGSLVRYDPHSVSGLMDSHYWTLLDGFMSQSRLWLLELFEWAFYQEETSLRLAR